MHSATQLNSCSSSGSENVVLQSRYNSSTTGSENVVLQSRYTSSTTGADIGVLQSRYPPSTPVSSNINLKRTREAADDQLVKLPSKRLLLPSSFKPFVQCGLWISQGATILQRDCAFRLTSPTRSKLEPVQPEAKACS